MIGPDLRVEGFDVTSWTRLVGLFVPSLEGAATKPDGGTLLLVDDHERQILMARHSSRGALPALVGQSSAQDLRALVEAHDARRIVVVRVGAMDNLSDALADGLAAESAPGYVAQWLVLLRALRAMMEVGEVRVYPNPLAGVPVPTARVMQRAFDRVLPDGTAAVAALFERGRPFTSLVVRRRAGLIDLVAGPDLIRRWAGPLGGDWRRDHRVLTQAIERHVAPVHVGLFAEADAVRTALRSGEAGEWTKQVAIREVVINPMPGAIRLALGADAVRGLRALSSDLLGGVDLWGAAAPVLRQLRGRWSEIRSVSEELGFDPFVVLAALLRSDEPDSE